MSVAPIPARAPQTLAAALIRENFASDRGQLLIGGLRAADLAAAYGSPIFVYDGDQIIRRYQALSSAVAGFADVYFSIKANPNPAISALLVDAGAGLEIASGAEWMLARAAGASPHRILFAGPGKSGKELEVAIAGGIGEIHLESFEEIEAAGAIASRLGQKINVAIRINPTTAAQGGAMRMGGKPAAFGFDEEIVGDVLRAVAGQPFLNLSGVHLFAGTQILDAKVLLAQWTHGLQLAAHVAEALGRPLATVDLGGGLGIPYHEGDAALDLDAVRTGSDALNRLRIAVPNLAGTHIIIEPGRYLTGPAGIYLMAVRAVKTSRGQRFIIADGGMHHHLAASGNLGQVIKRDYPIVAAERLDDASLEPATLVGPLCTPLDTLGRQTHLPHVTQGDLIAVLQSGAYGLSASPVGFLSHPMPAEILVRNGQHRCIRPAGEFSAPLVNLPVS